MIDYFLSFHNTVSLFFLRPEMDTEWTYIREPIETNSMVLKGLIPETEYQFVVRAVNMHGVSPPSRINNPVRTLGKAKCWSLSQTTVLQFQQFTHTNTHLCFLTMEKNALPHVGDPKKKKKRETTCQDKCESVKVRFFTTINMRDNWNSGLFLNKFTS